MTIVPEYQALFEPVLKVLQHEDAYLHFDDIADAIGDQQQLTTRQLAKMLPSGRQTVYTNNLRWALSYLKHALLIDTDGQGGYRVTYTALKQLNANKKINLDYQDIHQHCEYDPIYDQAPNIGQTDDRPAPEKPHTIAEQSDLLYTNLKQDVLDRVLQNSPAFFENLIIDLLLAMGYGNRRRDLTKHLGKTGDGGIDGAINQDQLGLDVVYIQAKRYKPGAPVPVSAVRDFAGAIEAHKANKGVFVTTTGFTKSGRQFIDRISKRIVLIDGKRLCELLIRNNIGVRVRETFEIKRIDEDYYA